MTDIKKIWNKNADSWDRQSDDPNNYYTRRNNFVLGLVRRTIHKGSVLDVGCGAGVLCLKLSTEGYDVYGTDISENLVQKTVERLSRNGIRASNSKDRFRVCQEHGLLFDEGLFDAITLIDVIIYVDDYEAYLSMLSRYVKDSGYIIASCTNRVSLFVFVEIVRHILRFRPNREWLRVLMNLARTGIPSGGHVDYSKAKQVYSSGCFDSIFSRLGFRKIDQVDFFRVKMWYTDSDPLHRRGLLRFLAHHLA